MFRSTTPKQEKKLFANHEGHNGLLRRFLRKGIFMREIVIRPINLLLTRDFAIGIPYCESRRLIIPTPASTTVFPIHRDQAGGFTALIFDFAILQIYFIYIGNRLLKNLNIPY